MTETQTDKILKLLAEESPLSPKVIGERLGIKTSSVRPILSSLKSMKMVEHHKSISGIVLPSNFPLFQLTDLGRKIVEEKQSAGSQA